MRGRGIKGWLLRKARRTVIPSKIGPCELCNSQGRVRYFVAAKLPRFMYLCDRHYLKVRDRLERVLRELCGGKACFGGP